MKIARFIGSPNGFLYDPEDALDAFPSTWVKATLGGKKITIDLSKAYVVEDAQDLDRL